MSLGGGRAVALIGSEACTGLRDSERGDLDARPVNTPYTHTQEQGRSASQECGTQGRHEGG